MSFEKSFERLEQIVNKINQGSVPLDETLTLYEEADTLIKSCQGKLSQAEEKIETLVKNRENKLLLDEDNQPITETLV